MRSRKIEGREELNKWIKPLPLKAIYKLTAGLIGEDIEELELKYAHQTEATQKSTLISRIDAYHNKHNIRLTEKSIEIVKETYADDK